MAATNIQSFSGDVEVSSNLTVDTNTLHVDSVAGRVGIGKTNPAYAVDVNGTLNATSLYLGGTELEGSPWSSNNSNTYYTTGAVGIGTDFPKKDLEVDGTFRLSNTASTGVVDFLVTGGSNPTYAYTTEFLTGAPTAAYARFGFSCAISSDGSYAVHIAQGDTSKFFNKSGSSYSVAYTGSGSQKVVMSDNGSHAVTTDYVQPGSTRGIAYVYTRSGSSWSYTQSLEAPGPTPSQADSFGYGADMSPNGSYLLIGARGDQTVSSNQAGAAHLFYRSGSSWIHSHKFQNPYPSPSFGFGSSCAISDSGTHAAVGSWTSDFVAFYEKVGSTWTLRNTFYNPSGGHELSMSSDGSYAAESQTNGGSRVWVYQRSGSSWSNTQYLTPPDGAPSFGYHHSMSSDGNTLVVGTTGPSGGVYVYNRSGSTFSYSTKFTHPEPGTSSPTTYLGKSTAVSSDGTYIMAGDIFHQHSGYNAQAGTAYLWTGESNQRLNVSAPIEAAGTLLSFTGQHICFPEGSMSQGLVVSANKNKYVTLNGPLTMGARAIKSSESLPMVSLSNVANDCSVFGVVDHFENGGALRTQESGVTVVHSDRELGDNRVVVNSLGEGAMWVANTNGPLESGDYITTSNIAGYGQRQDDTIVHSYTVAKITMDCDFDPKDVPIHVIKKGEDGYNVMDQYGRIQWEEDPDQTEREYNIRYLTTDGGITDEANAVWKAAYVGCTYHCG
jgi:hypothetical protein